MNLNGNEISLEYQEELRRSKAVSVRKCPSAAILMKLARGTVRAGQRERLVNHLGTCLDCAREYSAIFNIVREEKLFIEQAGKIHSAASASKERSVGWSSFPVLSWRSGLAAFLLICVAAAGTIVVTRSFRTSSELRSGSLNRVKAIAPIRDTFAAQEIVFQWEKVEKSEYYIVELFDQEFRPAWKSPRIESSPLAIPAAAAEIIQEDGTYFWTVTAYLTGGDEVKSDLKYFFVKK